MTFKVKWKVLLSLVLVLLMGANSFAETSNKETNEKDGTENGVKYNKKFNTFSWITRAGKAKEGVSVKYQIIGFKISVGYINPDNPKDRGYYYMHFMPEHLGEVDDGTNDPNMRVDEYEAPFSGSDDSIHGLFMAKYKDSPASKRHIDSFFAEANRPLQVDAVLSPIINGVPQGDMISNGGVATFTGRVYHTANHFLNDGINWGPNTRKHVQTFYGIPLKFDKQSVGNPEPVITRVLPNGTHEEKDVHIFKEGEPITLSGEKTYFPSQTSDKEFHWSYRKVGESTFKIVNSSDAGSPFKDSLPVGEYEIELEATAIYKRNWDGKTVKNKSLPDKKAKTKLIIKDNESPSIDVSITAPEQVKYEEDEVLKNIPVTLNVAVSGVDAKNIKHITLKMDEGTQKKEENVSPSSTITLNHDFPIMHDKDKHVYFNGKATLHLKNGKSIESNLAVAKTYIYKKLPQNLPPVPILDMPSEIGIGDAFIRGGRSFDIDGTVIDYYFEVPATNFYQSSEDETTKGRSSAVVRFMTAGEFDVYLSVKDNLGAMSFTSQRIKVTPPVPIIRTNVKGFLKENRKVTFMAHNESEFISRVGNAYTWEISPMTEGLSQDHIKMVSSTGKEIDVLFKKKGQYLVTAKGRNEHGMDGSYSMVINVAEDMAPISKIGAVDVLYRDATSKSTVNVYDNSYSVDGDFIEKRMWFYRFDSNNDGNFNDEQWVNGKVTNDHLDRGFSFEAVHVGRYEVRAVVTETFGQETIPAFVNYLDYKKTDGRRSMEVDNIKPSVSYDAYFEKQVDLAIITDYEEDKLLEVESKLNQFVNDSFDAYLNVKFDVISEKKYIGRYLHEEAEGYTSVPNTETPKYVVANWNGLKEYSDHSYEVDYTTKKVWNGDVTKTTQGVFPSRIKASYLISNGNAVIWLLENKDVYFMGINSKLNGWYASPSVSQFAMSPILLLSEVEQIEGGENQVYLRTKKGEVYALGTNFGSDFHKWNPVSDTEYRNMPNYNSIAPFVEDPMGQAASAPQFAPDRTSGYTSAVKLNGVSNAVYIWSNGGAFVYKKSNGDWYGFGSGLNAFGHPTGFSSMNIPNTWHDAERHYERYKANGTHIYYSDNTRSLVKLNNLTHVNNQVGGIEWIEAGKVYSKLGKVYTLNSSSKWHFEYMPFRFVISEAKFSYSESGTWQDKAKKDRQNATLWASKEQINASTIPLSKYADHVKDFKSSVKTIRSEGTSVPRLEPEIKYLFLSDKSDPYFDYKGIAYTINFIYTHKTAVTWKEIVGKGEYAEEVTRRGFDYHYKTDLGTKVLEITSDKQAGWKTYGIDPTKIGKISFREEAFKYLLYLGEKDSFRKISPDLLETLKKNHVASRVSTENQWVDRNVDEEKEINLRHILNATPYGKLYESNAIDKMLSDILKEHEIVRSKDGGLYAIVNEDTIEFSKFYRDLEGDPKFSDKNIISHDETYFDNSMGKSYFDKKTIIQPSIKLDKVGRYELKYSAVDNPVKTDERFKNYRKESDPTDLVIYAHRRPIAQYVLEWDFEPSTNLYTSTWTDTSFDYDHLDSDAKKGIRDYKLSYRKAEEGSTWISGVPNNLYPGDYELRYKVKDVEGAWSKEIFEPFTLLKEPLMTLKAKLSSEFPLQAIPASELLSIVGIESKYHRPHDLHIHLYNDKGAWVSQVGLFLNADMGNYDNFRNLYKWKDVPYRLPAHLKDGAYKMVVSAKSPWAEKSVTLEFGIVTPIKVKGQVPDLMRGDLATLKATSTPYAHEVRLTAFKGTAFESEKFMVKKGDFWGVDLEVPSAYAEEYADFEFRAYTKSGKMASHSIRREVKGASIKAFEIRGAWSYWDGRINALGRLLEKNAHRFLSYEKVTFVAAIEGDPDEVYVRLSPELEAMVYTNSKGQTYYYREHFAEDVEFPIHLVKVGEGLYEGTYILPLADTTINFEEVRLRHPYFARLYVRKGTKTINQTIEDIDLTGNIYELIHAQPKRP